eukprot:3375637-Prymnesium_polylepis.1
MPFCHPARARITSTASESCTSKCFIVSTASARARTHLAAHRAAPHAAGWQQCAPRPLAPQVRLLAMFDMAFSLMHAVAEMCARAPRITLAMVASQPRAAARPAPILSPPAVTPRSPLCRAARRPSSTPPVPSLLRTAPAPRQRASARISQAASLLLSSLSRRHLSHAAVPRARARRWPAAIAAGMSYCGYLGARTFRRDLSRVYLVYLVLFALARVALS